MAGNRKQLKRLAFLIFCSILLPLLLSAQKRVRFSADTSLCDTGQWRMVWNDEFEGNRLDLSKWYTFIDDENWVNGVVADPPVSAAARASKKVVYKDENVSVANGNCTLTVKYEPSEWMGAQRNFSSGMIMVKNADATAPLYFVRGRFEMRAKLPRATGIWATLWLYGGGSATEPGSEIDMLEYAPCQSDLDRIPWHIHGFHRGSSLNVHNETGGSYRERPDDWHIYTTEWDRHFIRFYVDGNLKAAYSRYGSDCVPDATREYPEDAADVFPGVEEGMKLLATLDLTDDLYSRSVAGICVPIPRWLKNRNKTDEKFSTQHFIIDYIRVYQREGAIQDIFSGNN